jgi:S1-C subfamily serine protease
VITDNFSFKRRIKEKMKAFINYHNFSCVKITVVFILMQLIWVNSILAIQKRSDNINIDVRDAMVKIYTVSSKPSYYTPWQMGSPERSHGSGCIIAKQRILTNAHVVSNQKFIQVQPYGKPKRYDARVLYISHETDLAILTVDDKSFFSGIQPLEVGALPETLQEVLVYGYPTGGDSLSITKGILSRIAYQKYIHSNYYFLAGQIDAAINPGNSGGPVIADNKIAGVVMQKYTSDVTESIGFMIPPSIIAHFLKDIDDGNYDGFPEKGFIAQKMENPSMKSKYGMKKNQTGVLVTNVFWNSSAQNILRKGEVILTIDGHTIADNGTVEFRLHERIYYTHYADMHQVGGKLHLTVLRDGKIRDITYTLNKTGKEFFLVKPKQYDHKPRYFIFAGIVFSPLTENLICEWQNCDAPNKLMVARLERPTKKRQEVVVAVQVLAADVNKGYHSLQARIIQEVNGKTFRNFNEFYRLVAMPNEAYVVFKDDEENLIVIDRAKAQESHDYILQTYDIQKDQSHDLEIVQKKDFFISKKK